MNSLFLRYCCFFFSITFLSINIQASQPTLTKHALIDRVEHLLADEHIAINENIDEVELLLSKSKQNQWHELIVKLETIRAEILFNTKDIKQVNTIIEEQLPLAKEYNLTSVEIKLNTLQLLISDRESNNKSSDQLRRELKEKIQHIVNRKLIACTHLHIGESHYKYKNFIKALSHFNKSYQLFSELSDNNKMFDAKLGGIKTLVALHKSVEAKVGLAELANIKMVLASAKYQLKHAEIAAQVHALNGEHQQAFLLQQEHDDLLAEIRKKEKKRNIEELMLRYDTEKNELDKALLQKENALQDLTIHQQNNENKLWTVIISCAAMASIISIYMVFIQTKNRNKFKQLALYDHLTNAPNRRSILESANSLFQSVKNTSSSMSIAIADLDNFKQFNDKYGHDIGDIVLKAFAQACVRTLRKSDLFGRYGGEEWLFIFPHDNITDIIAIFKRLQLTFNQIEISEELNDCKTTFSVGVARFSTQQFASFDELIKSADLSLYQAKNTGRDRLACENKVHTLSS